MIDIVICVDGTNSHTYKNSSVRNFFHNVKVPPENKIFHEGPRKMGGVTGSDWLTIRDEVIRELNKISQRYGEESFINGYQCTTPRRCNFRFIMVGHSRGGHIIIHLAAMLKYRTYFMGLYDAVERTDTMSWDNFSQVVYNVDHVYHARRNPLIGSRNGQLDERNSFYKGPLWRLAEAKLMDFKNTGLSTGDGGAYVEKLFMTSHGGIGGEVLNSTLFETPFSDDTSCAITFFNQDDMQVKKNTTCIMESGEADLFIRLNA
jgi:hypothetical protein